MEPNELELELDQTIIMKKKLWLCPSSSSNLIYCCWPATIHVNNRPKKWRGCSGQHRGRSVMATWGRAKPTAAGTSSRRGLGGWSFSMDNRRCSCTAAAGAGGLVACAPREGKGWRVYARRVASNRLGMGMAGTRSNDAIHGTSPELDRRRWDEGMVAYSRNGMHATAETEAVNVLLVSQTTGTSDGGENDRWSLIGKLARKCRILNFGVRSTKLRAASGKKDSTFRTNESRQTSVYIYTYGFGNLENNKYFQFFDFEKYFPIQKNHKRLKIIFMPVKHISIAPKIMEKSK